MFSVVAEKSSCMDDSATDAAGQPIKHRVPAVSTGFNITL